MDITDFFCLYLQVINFISFKTKVMEENTTALSEQNQNVELQDSTQEMLELAEIKEEIESVDYSEM